MILNQYKIENLNMDKDKDKGIFYWITGLSGAGKTTIGKLLYAHIKKEKIM